MSVKIDLSPQEARLLTTHLNRYIEHLDVELVRTDKHELQHEFAREIEALRSIGRRLEAASRD